MNYKELKETADYINCDAVEIFDENGVEIDYRISDKELHSKEVVSSKRQGSWLTVTLRMTNKPLTLADLKAGDEVVVRTKNDIRLRKIERITPAGFICVNGVLYNKDGSARGNTGYWSPVILVPTSELRSTIHQNETKAIAKQVVNKLAEKLSEPNSYETAKKIINFYKSLKEDN